MAQSLLGKKLAGASTATPAKSPLAVVLERGARGELVQLPGLGPAWIRLLGSDEVEEVEAEVIRAMTARNIPPPIGYAAELTAQPYELRRARCTLARAVRSPAPADREIAFGSLEEWGQIDSDIIVAAWHVYGDVRERLAPLDEPVTDEVRRQITAAWKKKDTMLLRSFGVSALAIYLATTEFPPESSPTPTSSDGASSSGS